MTSKARNTEHLTPWVLGVAVLLQTLDATSVAVALPAIAVDLQRDTLAVSATISAYLLGAAASVPPCGWLADRFGGRNVFLLGILSFVLASVACAMAPSLHVLLVARFTEGAAGALLLPVGRMVIMRTFAADERVRAYTTFVLPALLGPMLGPLVGGMLVEYASWRWIFLLNVPLGLCSLLAVYLLLGNFRETQPRKMDLLGMLITSLALLVFVLGLIMLSRALWQVGTIAVALGLLLGVLAVAHAWHHEHALLQLSLLRSPLFRRALGTDLCCRLLMNAAPVLLSLLLQSRLGLSPSLTGILIVMIAVGSLLTKPYTYRWLDRYGCREVMASSTVLAALAFISCALLTPTSSPWLIGALLLAFGFFRSLTISATAVMIFHGVAPEDTGAATTLSAIGQQVFQVMGLTGVTILMQLSGGQHPSTVTIAEAIVVSGLLSLTALYFIFRIGPVTLRP